MSVPVNPYVVVHSDLTALPWHIVDVRTGNTIHMAYGRSWAGYSNNRGEAAGVAAAWNRSFQAEWRDQHPNEAGE